jgi:MoaA/NifB/PqqE/SkfB family radical SAM enzyme
LKDIQCVWNHFLVYSSCLFNQIHAPRGIELLDILRERLQLLLPDGRWKREEYNKYPSWRVFLEDEIQLLKMRRDSSCSQKDKRHWNLQLLELEAAQVRQNACCYPRRINIEITDNCNLRCPMCSQGCEDLPRVSLEPDHIIASLTEINPYLEQVELIGLGEPLTSPVFLKWINQWPLQPAQTFSTTTNALLLDEEMTEHILHSQLNQIRFSVDGITPETYRRMRGRDDFSLLQKNLAYFMKRKKETGKKMEVWIRMVATRTNVHELPAFIEYANRLGVDLAEVMHLFAYTPPMWKLSLIFGRPLWNHYYDKAAVLAEKTGIRYRFPRKFDLDRKPVDDEFKKVCREPWEYFYVTSEGKFRACCINLAKMGDLRTESFAAIWNGSKYKAFRNQLINLNSRLYRCRYCYLNFIYGDVNNIHTHLIDLKAHYQEMGEDRRLHLPDETIDNYIEACLRGESVPFR